MRSQSKRPEKSFDRSCDDLFDLDTLLLHPAGAFAQPADVVRDPDLTLNEKRAILASWASDACAIEAAPALRQPPGAARPVSFDDVMDGFGHLHDTGVVLLLVDRHYLCNRSERKYRAKARHARMPRPIKRSGNGWRTRSGVLAESLKAAWRRYSVQLIDSGPTTRRSVYRLRLPALSSKNCRPRG